VSDDGQDGHAPSLGGTSSSDLPMATAIIVAAGRSTRMEGVNKLFAEVNGRPLLYHTLAAFQACRHINHITVVLSLDGADRGLRLLRSARLSKVDGTCVGGERRQDSVRAGLAAVRACEWVVIHDGARPLVTAQLIEKGIAEAQLTGASSAGLPVVDTLKETATDKTVLWTVSRERLWAVQTPQVFRFGLLEAAHEREGVEATDDAELIERAGGRVRLYEGSPTNLKVTTREDLIVAGALLHARRAQMAAI
jgi:2-C-methyl-D-erythritol 4-phosphate cytidylyltransferase